MLSNLTPGRIGVKPLLSNALLMAQKKNGAAEINDSTLKHFPGPKAVSLAKEAKGSASSDEEDEDSGDEAEKLDEKQLNEIDTIYKKQAYHPSH